MVATASYVLENDRAFTAALKRALDELGDLRAPFSQILHDFYKSEKAIFSLKGPGSYPPFKHSEGAYKRHGRALRYQTTTFSPYQKQKLAKYGFDYPLLVRTGRLAASLLSKDAPGSVALIGPTEMVIGTTVPYGIYHQSDAPRQKMPLRKFLFIGPESKRFETNLGQLGGRPARWMRILNDYVLKSMRKHGYNISALNFKSGGSNG